MESGRHIAHMEESDTGELVRQVVEDFRGQACANPHRVELRMPSERCRIRADRDGLTRALWNLLENAVKYSPESSTVRVSVEHRREQVGISVEDEGCGIPENEQRQVFRKFVRGTAARDLQVKGTGIGLAMVERIVREHHGRVELTSVSGRGSRFTILLPAEVNHQ